jgi:polyribonucleotide nucleotidyltransferase
VAGRRTRTRRTTHVRYPQGRLESGKVARQADGAVIATYGETTVIATVVSAHAPKPGLDFFPLT